MGRACSQARLTAHAVTYLIRFPGNEVAFDLIEVGRIIDWRVHIPNM